MILIVLLYALLAVIFLLCKISVAVAKPLFFVGVRMLLAGTALLAFEQWRHKGVSKLFREHKKHFLALIVFAFFHTYLAFVPEFLAIPYLTSIKLNLLWALSPFVAAVLAYLLHRERLKVVQWSGIFVGFAGMLPYVFAGGEEAAAALAPFLLPEVGLMIAVVAAAYAWFLFKRLLDHGVSMMMGNGVAMFVSSFAILGTSYFYEGWHDTLFDSWFHFWAVLFALLIISNVIYYNLYAYLMHRYSITFLTVCGFMAPLFGAVLGWFFLGEAIGWQFYVAAVSVAVGLYLFSHKGKVVDAGPITQE